MRMSGIGMKYDKNRYMTLDINRWVDSENINQDKSHQSYPPAGNCASMILPLVVVAAAVFAGGGGTLVYGGGGGMDGG